MKISIVSTCNEIVNETTDPNYSNTSSVHPVYLDSVLDTQPSHSPDIDSDICRSRFHFSIVRGMDLTTSAATHACESFWTILVGDVSVVTDEILGIKRS
jgi:hypothetical protein